MKTKLFLLIIAAFMLFSISYASAAMNCNVLINASTTLTSSLTGCSGSGPQINNDSIVLDCNGTTISGNGGSTGISVPSPFYNITIKNCTILNFAYGISLSSTGVGQLVFNNTIANNTIGISIESGSSTSGNITENTIISNGQGIVMNQIMNIWRNNIYNNTLQINNLAAAVNLSYNNQGNYWGRSSCPLFKAGTDTSDLNTIDRYPYNASNAWVSGINPASSCALKATINAPSVDQKLTLRTIQINVTVTEQDCNANNLTISVRNSEGEIVASNLTTGSMSSVNTSLNVISDGSFSIYAELYDIYGRYNTTSVNVTVDTTAPALTITSPVNSTYYNNTQLVMVDFTASDAVNNLSTMWYFNGTGNTTVYAAGNTSYYRYTNSINYTTNGSRTFIFYANDSLNLIVNRNVTFNVASAAPANSTFATTQNSITVNENISQIIVAANSSLQNINIPSNFSNQSVLLDLSQLAVSGNLTLNNSFTLVRIGDVNYTVVIPAGTNVSGASGWNGLISLPVVNYSNFSLSGADSVDVVIDVGSPLEITFSNPVKIIIGGMAGKSAAWARGSTSLDHKISTLCTSETVPGISSGECYTDSADDNDLIIWTYHFTSFAAYTPTPDEEEPSSGGGGGCSTTWNCTEWSACNDGVKKRICSKVKSYCSAGTKPDEEKDCAETVISEEAANETVPLTNETITTGQAEKKSSAFWIISAIVIAMGAVASIIYYLIPRGHDRFHPKAKPYGIF